MIKINKVSIILVIVAATAIIIAIFAFNRSGVVSVYPSDDYERDIKELNDSIEVFKAEIESYRKEITRIDYEREKLKDTLSLLMSENEEIDSILANGEWNDNIRFLTEFLSKNNSVGK